MPRAFASADECASGTYELTTVAQSTFIAPVEGVCQVGGYSLLTIPDELLAVYNGFTMGSTVPLCEGGHLSGNTCVNYTTGGDCTQSNTDYDLALTSSTFIAPVSGICQVGGYSLINIPSEVYAIYNGFLMGSAVSLCDGGYMANGSTCTQYTTSENCPSGYKDMAVNVNTFAELTNGSCSNPYSLFANTSRCDNLPGATCVDLPTPVININWMDGENTITTNTCLYDGTITLPAEPTRPGYTFAGWRLAD